MDKNNHFTLLVACMALYLAADNFVQFLLSIAAAIVFMFLTHIMSHLYRYVLPNRKGCGVRLSRPTDQWQLFCNDRQQCNKCNPRNGREIPS